MSIVSPGFIRDAGMFHESGAQLPPGVGTKLPQEVADATLKAVERNLAEVEVAPLALRAGTLFAQVSPELAAKVSRRMGAGSVARDVASGQRAKR